MRLALAFAALAACVSAQARVAPSVPARPRPPATPVIYKVVVVFTSWGAGVDLPTIARYHVIVDELEANIGPVQRHTAYWGREGEFNVCFPLTDVDPWYHRGIIDNFRDNLEPDGHAFVLENAPCGDD